MQQLIPQEFPFEEIPQAQHHVFLDQPLAFIDSLTNIVQKL
jgi:hypothetical protein